ncbi:hypothetical protein AXG93_3439s1010 [Marchantia polymorpha subsp. ruderalis]|uniref:Leucine-rich repeat-containing N-terminal plant-type domain-containing protein n=1 Tax=Marchantia polymorpha subsp. ruderalis TaxID=1480154 RepID=A0A176W387_MARPO|nr:hypothetical protein AXG93_3439s1010 [Marchantia polymorpha subsp. ruderalis]
MAKTEITGIRLSRTQARPKKRANRGRVVSESSDSSVAKTDAAALTTDEEKNKEHTLQALEGETSAVQVEAPMEVVVEPLEESTEIASLSFSPSEQTWSMGSEEVPKSKSSEEMAEDLTLSEEMFEQVVAQVSGTVVEVLEIPSPPPLEEEVRPEVEKKVLEKEPKELVGGGRVIYQVPSLGKQCPGARVPRGVGIAVGAQVSEREDQLPYGSFLTLESTSWSRLDKVFIDGNNFCGGFPRALTDMTALTKIYMFNNEFTGGLPENLGQLANLREFSFRSNQQYRELPNSLNNCTKLFLLDAAYIRLTGTLDPLRNPSLLTYINLGSSYRSKNITWENLRGHTPDLVLNSFTGTLTDDVILQWPLLQYLYLDTNAFTGPIPKSLGDLADLKDLLLNDNDFRGHIPAELGKLSNLTLLFLHNNQLSGPILTSLADLKSIH